MTIIINTQEELESHIENGIINIDDDLQINCIIDLNVDFTAKNVTMVKDLTVKDINFMDFISPANVSCGSFRAASATLNDIVARNINVFQGNLEAEHIEYVTSCFAEGDLTYTSQKGASQKAKFYCNGVCVQRS